MLELRAKIIEKDDARRNELLKSLGRHSGVEVVVVDDQIQISLTGGANETREFADLMRVCEMCECHMFQLRKR
ncbi:hypothetical protein IJH02_03300 [Candidatus Saccharibacteria bacterium]|nr:hypothetical protein [Candidatus Saccharibacteria bacterium]